MHVFRCAAILVALGALVGCQRQKPQQQTATHQQPVGQIPPVQEQRRVWATGTIRAVREFTVRVPAIAGQTGGRLTLVKVLPSGTAVEPGGVLAEFDHTQQLDNARDSQAKLDDLNHQIDQRKAENKANAETRLSEYEGAVADLEKARLQLRRNETLSHIERAKNEERAAAAQFRIDSLAKSHALRKKVDAAALRILELKRDRQAVALKRAETNVTRLVVRAPHGGMVALESIWRGETRGPAQEGDQVYPGQTLLRLFDPEEMEVHTSVAEPDGAILGPGSHADVRLDAYADAVFPALFLSASPVATADLGSPIKRFAARFLIEKRDARLLPDLSAAVMIRQGGKQQ